MSSTEAVAGEDLRGIESPPVEDEEDSIRERVCIEGVVERGGEREGRK